MASEVIAQASVEKFGAVSSSPFTAFENTLNQYMKGNYVVFLRSSTQQATSKTNKKSRNPKKLLSKISYDRLPVNRRLTEDELGTCRIFLKNGTPSCEVRHLVADEFGPLVVHHSKIGCTRTVRNGSLWQCEQNRLESANGRLKYRVHHGDTLEHAIRKVSRHAEWLMLEFEMHTSYHCDRRQILVGDGYFLNVVCRMTRYGCFLFLKHLGPRSPRLPYDIVGTNKPPPTAFGALRKPLNRVVDKLQGLEPRKATASFQQLIVHGQIPLRQGSNSATDGLPSVVEDTAPQPRWRSRDTNLGFCVLCDRPSTTKDRWCATDRASYHADCCDGVPCPLCGDSLQACPKAYILLSLDDVNGQINAPHEDVCASPGRTCTHLNDQYSNFLCRLLWTFLPVETDVRAPASWVRSAARYNRRSFHVAS
ncbi:hypothetical protein CLF_104887 [Clonorchis sinensis]|uniref:Uncharacterized protein n=1 Tax=Clonorchis sinensis TaxID=79923 RepID=G7YCI6_CLOSI|nr:hypothetical protein CLF_104887 [Clonorchis sinensis]